MADSVLFATGARGSGKSSLIKQHARGFGRVLAWSPLEETDGYGPMLGVEPCSDLDVFVRAAAAGSAVYAPHEPTPERFDMFCKVVWYARDCLLVVDELADVTPIGKAVGWWGAVVRKGRHRNICIAAGAQRPAEIDKTIIGNCTRIACFRMSRWRDRAMMADELGVDRAMLEGLRPLEFLDADMLTGQVTRRRIVFA